MSDINNVSNDVLNSLSIRNTSAATEEKDELGQDAFLQLLIAQLEHQDPLNPSDNGEFLAQLAQFSTLESQENMSASMAELSTAFRSSQALEASSLVGRKVEVPGNVATLGEDGEVKGTLGLDASATNVKLTIESVTGEIIQTQELGSQRAGDVDFTWNGTNQSGLPVAQGQYRVRATGLVDGETRELNISVGANVNSVTVGQNDSLILNVEGVGSVDLDDVKRFL